LSTALPRRVIPRLFEKDRTMRPTLLGAPAALAFGAGAASAQPVEWRFHNSSPAGRADSAHVHDLAADLRQRTNGVSCCTCSKAMR
jgi:hypothetical protein